MIRVAVIGLGYFSHLHLAAWQANPETEIVATTDLDPDRRAWAEDTFNVPTMPDLAAALASSPDIIDIVAPPSAHAALVSACLERGRIIICQKPFCTSLDEARSVTQAAEDAGATLLIHENFRFQPWYRTLKAQLDSGALGQVYSARFDLRPGDGRGPLAYLDRQPVFQTMPRLLIQETGVHFIDLFRWLLGDVREVYADLRRLNPHLAGEDAGLLVMTHADGAISTFDGNRLADHETDSPRRTMGKMVLECEAATLRVDGYGRVQQRDFGSAHWREIPLVVPMDETFGGGCVAALCAHVVDACAGRGVFENPAREYLTVLALCEAAYASASSGQKLTIKEGET